jgi:hypothetical protein
VELDTAVKLNVYETIVATTQAPSASDVATAIGCSPAEVEASFQRLFQRRLLVLEPGTTSRIRMAPPFSGVPTQHVAVVDGKSYYADCAWDALGVAAALHRDADIASECPDCKEPMAFQVQNGRPVPRECVIHFAVPAARWWDDVIHT